MFAACGSDGPAFGKHTWGAERGALVPHAILVLAFAGEQITELAAFLGAEALERFGLPAELAA